VAANVEARVAIRIEGLKHAYQGNTVLDIDELDVLEGEILALIGPNGAGKSTLLRLINLLERPVQGDITYWDGSHLADLPRKQRRLLGLQMATVFQDALLFKRPVKANIAYGLRTRGVKKDERKQRVAETLDMLGLSELADRYALSLSGGEAQKVSLGRALVLKPRILLMDEPFASLDYPSRMAMRDG
jgi:tungstate transport system ATP-binding protein